MMSYSTRVFSSWLAASLLLTSCWGNSDRGARVAYGTEVPDGLMPYFLDLRSWNEGDDGQYWCEGTLIASGWVLTAAGCVMSSRVPHDNVVFRIGVDSSNPTIVRPSAFSTFVPDDFDPEMQWEVADTLYGNIALIKVPDLENIQGMKYPSLPKSMDELDSAPILVTAGTGEDETGTQDVTDLKFVTLSRVNIDGAPIAQDAFLAVDLGGDNQGFCSYDYGAGLIVPGKRWVGATDDDDELEAKRGELTDEMDVIVGVASFPFLFDSFCGGDGAYMFTNVFYWLSWIEETMAAN